MTITRKRKAQILKHLGIKRYNPYLSRRHLSVAGVSAYFGEDVEDNIYLTKRSARKLFGADVGYVLFCLSHGVEPPAAPPLPPVERPEPKKLAIDDEFAKAESCAADMEQSLLVPIVVACALAGLVLAICVAYIIGRRRTYSGYAAM